MAEQKIMAVKDYFIKFLPEEQLEDFGLWAFGTDYKEFYGVEEFFRAWNVMHGHKLMLRITPIAYPEDGFNMTNLWKRDGLLR